MVREGGPILASSRFPCFLWQFEASHCLKGRKFDFLLFSFWTGLYRGVDNYSVWGGISSVSVMGGSPGDVSENLRRRRGERRVGE